MSYHVNVETKLFDALTSEEAQDLLKTLRTSILNSNSNGILSHPAYSAWRNALGYTEDYFVLPMCPVFSQHALLSLLESKTP